MKKKELEQYLGKNVELISSKGEAFQGILYKSYDYFIKRDPDVIDYYRNKYCLSLPKRRFIAFTLSFVKEIKEIEEEKN